MMKMEVIEIGSGVEIGGEKDRKEEKWGGRRDGESSWLAEFWPVVEHGQIPERREVS